MNRIGCYFERLSNFTVGIILLIFGLGMTLIGFTVIPIIGLLVAVPVFALALAFLMAPRSKTCALITERSRKIISS
jgi:uncharacterized membrane protein